jgi:hypothetical protein
MSTTRTYLVTYEQGATNLIQANSLVEAITGSREALLSCMPKDFDPNNLVRAVAAKELRTKEDFREANWLTCHIEPDPATTKD